MRSARVLLLGLLVLGLLVMWLSPGDKESIRTSAASSPGVVDLVAIDARPYHCSANTATFLDNIDWGVDMYSIDESIDIDIVVDEVDPADGLSGFGADLVYDPTKIEVTAYDDEFLLDAAGPRIPATSTDPLPDYDGDFRFDSGDLSTNFEDGEGVLARITITCMSMGISTLWLDDVAGGDGVPDILDAGGAALSVGTAGGSWVACGDFVPTSRDFGIVEESVVGPESISDSTSDYVIETIIRNDGNWDPMDGVLTSEIMPPQECDVGAGPGNLHTIVTPLLAVPECTPQAVDVPFQVQCSAPGVREFDFQIWNEIEPDPCCPWYPPDYDPSDDMVSHEELPGAPPPLTLTPADSPGPALRVTVWNCPDAPWFVPAGDLDCDGFSTGDEGLIGTDPADKCANTPDPNDEADGRWPPDFDDNQVINVLDLGEVLPPYFGTSVPPTGPRRDLVPDGVINILDVGMTLPPFFGYVCT